MELLFRKYFWTLNLAFLLVAAFLAAKTVNVFVAAQLAPVPDFSGQPVQSNAQPVIKPVLVAEALSKVTGVELPKPPPVEELAKVEETTAAAPDVWESTDPVKTGLRVKLVGTMVANRPEWSMANIEDITNHEVKVYMVGDHIQGAEIREIQRWRVLINNNGRKEYIDNEPGDGSVATVAAITPPPTAANTAAPPGPALGSGVRQTGEDTYEIEKGEIDKTLGNLNAVAMQARIVPAFKDGVATGFKLFSIRPDSIYSKIGIQNGDVIRRINGFEINSPDKALEVYSKLKESSRIEIEVDRNGSPVRKTYNVR
ncbi:MAG: type II secretion system protein GspC [Myxococcales bacterium]